MRPSELCSKEHYKITGGVLRWLNEPVLLNSKSFIGGIRLIRATERLQSRWGVSPECVRYWCRRQRDGGDCQTRYACRSPGLLSRFDAKVRYVILRLRLKHPRWGPSRIRLGLTKRPSLKGLPLPSETQIGRYLHQWLCFRHQRSARPVRERPRPPTQVHQRWQLDFKMSIALQDGSQVNLHTVRDPVGAACLDAVITPAGRVGQGPGK